MFEIILLLCVGGVFSQYGYYDDSLGDQVELIRDINNLAAQENSATQRNGEKNVLNREFSENEIPTKKLQVPGLNQNQRVNTKGLNFY